MFSCMCSFDSEKSQIKWLGRGDNSIYLQFLKLLENHGEDIAASDISKEDAESHNSSKEWQEIEDQGMLILSHANL